MHIFKDTFIIVNDRDFGILFSLISIVGSHVAQIMTKASNGSNKELEISEMLSDGSGQEPGLHKHEKDRESMSKVMIGEYIVMK